MNASLRFALLPLLCLALAGCALGAAAGLGLAAQGAGALALVPLADAQERAQKDRCAYQTSRGVSVAESFEAVVPRGEPGVAIYEPVWWRPEFAREGYPQVVRGRTAVEGTLVVTERWVLFAPPPGAVSVRVPYEIVESVSVEPDAPGGAPRTLVVKSCYGRYDLVTFRRLPPASPDPDASAAAATLDARIAAFRASTN
jgi:hypothetical protein